MDMHPELLFQHLCCVLAELSLEIEEIDHILPLCDVGDVKLEQNEDNAAIDAELQELQAQVRPMPVGDDHNLVLLLCITEGACR